MELTNVGNFDSNFKRLKKFSLLRDYVSSGVDISEIYTVVDENTNVIEHHKQMQKFDEMDLNDIIDHFQAKFTALRIEWSVSNDSRNFKAGDDVETLLERLNQAPVYGEPFNNNYFNTLFRGKNKGKFLLRSGGTGTGKTFSSLIDSCDLGCSHIFDYETMNWKAKDSKPKPTLMISTEIDKEELQVNMLAYISGVAVSVIKNGRYSEEIGNRLRQAVQILKNSPIYIVYIPDFSISDIENIIEQHILEFGVEYVYFDYIQITPKLARTMASSFGMNLREDQILVNFAQALKTIAEKYDVFMCSSTQLNRNYKDTDNRDASTLRGGMATADKIDYGQLMFKVMQKDREKLKLILENKEYCSQFNKQPNMSHWIFKNRGGDSDVIVWTYQDRETMRETPLFVTDYDFNWLRHIEPTIIKLKEEEVA